MKLSHHYPPPQGRIYSKQTTTHVKTRSDAKCTRTKDLLLRNRGELNNKPTRNKTYRLQFFSKKVNKQQRTLRQGATLRLRLRLLLAAPIVRRPSSSQIHLHYSSRFNPPSSLVQWSSGNELEQISMECVVQGIIETQHVEALEILLQGLCGVKRERLKVHELCLKSGPNLGSVASEVRLLCDLEQPEPMWTVRHVGGAMRGAGADQISVLVRTMVESKASKNVLRLFNSLGYKLDHELLRVGFAFHFQRGAQIAVTVASVNKMLKLHATDDAEAVTPGIQLVEVTAPASSENYTEVAAAVSSFCEYLAPLLHLSKPGVSTGVVPTAAAAAASLMSDGGGTTL